MMLLSALAVHEAGHLAAFFLLREPPPTLRAVAAGLTLCPKRPLSYRNECLIALAGPLFNLLFALSLLLLARRGEAVAALFAVQLLMAAVNLLPLGGSDGARALLAGLLCLFPLGIAERTAAFVRLFAFFLFLFFLLYCLLYEGGSGALLLLLTLSVRALSK